MPLSWLWLSLILGSWIEELPTCNPIICTPLLIPNGFYDATSGGDGSPYYLDESIYYECVEGEGFIPYLLQNMEGIRLLSLCLRTSASNSANWLPSM